MHFFTDNTGCGRTKSWFLCLAILAFGLGAFLPAAASQVAPDPLSAARQSEQARDFSRAAQLYTRFLQDHSNRADIWQRLGLVYYLSSHFDQAAPALEHAARLNPSLWAAELFLGISQYRMGQFANAQKSLEASLQVKPGVPEALFWLGTALMAQGKRQEAAAQLEKVPADSPVAMDTDATLVQLYRELAENCDSQIQKIDLNSYRTHQLAAEAFAWSGKYQNAIFEYRKALQLNPQLEGAHRGIAQMYWQQRRFEPAVQEYQAELQNDPLDDEALLRIGEYRLTQGNVGDAVSELQAALRANKSSWEVYRALGEAAMASGDAAQAQGYLEVASQKNPSDAFSHKLLAQIYRSSGHPELADRQQEILQKLSAAEGN